LRGRGRSYRATLGGSVKQGSTIIAHLIGEDYAFFSRISGEKLGGNARFDSLKNRAEIMKAFRESYDYGARVWEGPTEEKALEMVAGRGGQQTQRWVAILGVIQVELQRPGERASGNDGWARAR